MLVILFLIVMVLYLSAFSLLLGGSAFPAFGFGLLVFIQTGLMEKFSQNTNSMACFWNYFQAINISKFISKLKSKCTQDIESVFHTVYTKHVKNKSCC